MGALFAWMIDHIAPVFLVCSPVTSYADQIYSIHKTRSSAGFSLDIPLIMLVASILKIFYWFGVHFDRALLIQAVVMIAMQTLLLHVALTNRAHTPPGMPAPFAAAASDDNALDIPRPYDFWRWRTATPYWHTLGYLTAALVSLHLLFGGFAFYAPSLGAVALAVEALLPLPQLVANQRRRGCKGFRASVLANWLVGDAFKMVFFFAKGSAQVPWAFKLCGVFQAACDVLLGLQFYAYGNGEPGAEGGDVMRDMAMLGKWTADKMGWDA